MISFFSFRDHKRRIFLAVRILSNVEKMIIWGLLSLAFLAALMILREHYYKNEIPNFGGTFTEGVVDSTSSDLNESISRLTKIGLTRFDTTGNVVPALVESWQISPDGLTYTFKLKNFAKSDDVIKTIRDQVKEWADISITKIDDSQIKFQLKQPLGPFLPHTTLPIFDFGPYKVTKTTKTEIVLDSNKNYWQGTPYINQIVLKLYTDEDSLTKAVQGGKVNGALLSDGSHDDYSKIEFDLPKYKMVFFNTAEGESADKGIRQKIAAGQNIGKEITLRMAVTNSGDDMALAGDLSQKWAPLGVKLEVTPYDSATLTKTIIPQRDYDVLLYGINYGSEKDPYPFFHSSQISVDGLNLSSFSNSSADKILEDARLTTDAAARKSKYQEFDKIFADEVPAITLSEAREFYYVSGQVKGVKSTIYATTAGDRFADVSHWYLKVKKVK